MKKADVTIVMPVYNAEKTMDRTFESILAQTYDGWKIVCVEDVSKDNTLSQLKEWQKKIGADRFTLVANQENSGVTKSTNTGLETVDTPYAARLDADDWWMPTKLEKQLAFLKKNPDYKVIGCNYINVTVTPKGPIEKKIVLPEDDAALRRDIIKANPFAHSCVVYDMALVRELGFYDPQVRYGQDYDLFLRMYPHTQYYNIQEFLCYRAVEPEGISVKFQKGQMLQAVKTKRKYIKYYGLSPINYIYLIELWVVAYTPRFVRDLKRRFLG